MNSASPARADAGAGSGTDAIGRAQAQAADSGEPVVVGDLTTPYSQTTANPDGTLTESSTTTPTRTKVDGSWTPIDSSLHTSADGGLRTAATLSPLTLSGGGSGPLATLTDADGRTLAVTMPFSLPAPTVDGSTAHYADVLPGVDLDVTATDVGGIREVLVVRSAQAAADPALAGLHLGTTGAGLTMEADAQGNLQAVDASGDPAFVAPAPLMWDSSTAAADAAPAGAKSAKSAGAAKAAGPAAAPEDAADPAPGDASTDEGPGAGAQTAAIPVTARGDGVDLAPVADVLHGADTTYPVYIDPSYIPWNPGDPTWTWIQSAYPSSSDNYGKYGTSHSSQPGVGICGSYPTGNNCSPVDKERTYYQFNTSVLVSHNDVVGSAVLRVTQTYSADWSCTNKYGISLYYSQNTISHSTTWDSHPTETSTGLTDQVGGTGSSGCTSSVPFAYTVTSTVKTAVETNNWNSITFGLHGNESDANGLKRLSNKATLDITYDHTPNQPTGLTMTPTPRDASANTTQPCSATVKPTTDSFVGNPGLAGGLQLKATLSSPTSPTQPVRGSFRLWDDSVSGAPTTTHGSGYSNGGGYSPSGSQVSFTVPFGDLTDGHAYGWNVVANDGILNSTTSASCHFRVDLTPPVVTLPSAPEQIPESKLGTTFPPAGNGQSTSVHVGQGGWVPYTVADPQVNGSDSGLACMRWGFDPELADALWQCGAKLPGSAGLASFPTHWGTNILYVEAEDKAGNYSGIAAYPFYVPWNPHGPAPVFGDTTGDATPDAVVAGSDGNLYAHTVPGNTQATSPALSLAARVADSPAGDAWSGYQITHRGSMRGGLNVDDLLVHKAASPTLYSYYNPGNTGTDGRFDKKVELRKPACVDDGSGGYCAGYAADWSTTQQIAALGDVSTTVLDAGHFKNRTGLLTTESTASGDAALWFYPTISDGTLGQPVRLAASGWKNKDLIVPGSWTGGSTPGLWARDRGSGDISGYTFTVGQFTPTDPFGDPLAPVPTLTAVSGATKIGNLPVATGAVVGSDGDLNGDGVPDLWFTTGAGGFDYRLGQTADGTKATAVNAFGADAVAGTTTSAADSWSLDGTGADEDALNPATLTTTATGDPEWGADRTGRTPGAAVLGGANEYLTTAHSAVDTTRSFTVSAWVKLDSLTGSQTVVSEGTFGALGGRAGIALGYDSLAGAWSFSSQIDASVTTATPAVKAGTPAAGVWTHLAGVYDAGTHIMTLYVNGQSGPEAATNPTPAFDPDAPLAIGGQYITTSGGFRNSLHGSVADVRTYPVALTAEEVAALAS